MTAMGTQIGGNHYKGMVIQPVEYIYKNKIGYFEGCVIKYVSRWKNKNGVEDLKKAIHFLELLIELENGKAQDISKETRVHGGVPKDHGERGEAG